MKTFSKGFIHGYENNSFEYAELLSNKNYADDFDLGQIYQKIHKLILDKTNCDFELKIKNFTKMNDLVDTFLNNVYDGKLFKDFKKYDVDIEKFED